jgi:hypothetical protein
MLGFNFQDVYYALNLTYWGLLLASLFTTNPLLARITHFENYTLSMCLTSLAFSAYFGIQWARDARRHARRDERRDVKGLLRYGWNAIFWLGFVLWYAAPAYPGVTELTGTPGTICCIFGLMLALSAAVQSGSVRCYRVDGAM